MSANYEFTHESLLRYLEGVRGAWEAVRGNEIERLTAENEKLKRECVRTSCHCAELIDELRGNFGVSDERLKQIAAKVSHNEQIVGQK